MKVNKNIVYILILVLVFSISFVFSDNGSGGGKSTALDLVQSTPADGETSVSIDTEILLLFNKNVVNMTVKDNNRNCIKLLNEDGTEVAADLIFPDDQINPDKKREISIKPKKPLEKGKKYIVKILPEFMAKNGTNLGKTIETSFETIVIKEETTKTFEDKESSKTSLDAESIKNKDEIVTQKLSAGNDTNKTSKDTNGDEVSDEVGNKEDSANSVLGTNETESIKNYKEEDSKEIDVQNNTGLKIYPIIAIIAIIIILAIVSIKHKKRK